VRPKEIEFLILQDNGMGSLVEVAAETTSRWKDDISACAV